VGVPRCFFGRAGRAGWMRASAGVPTIVDGACGPIGIFRSGGVGARVVPSLQDGQRQP